MQLVRDGEARAFEAIFDRHGDAAFSLAYRMCGRRTMAEDIVQEAFLSLWRSGARYDRARGSVRSWILSVVHNRAIDAFRRDLSGERREVRDESVAERMPAGELTEREVERRDDARHGPEPASWRRQSSPLSCSCPAVAGTGRVCSRPRWVRRKCGSSRVSRCARDGRQRRCVVLVDRHAREAKGEDRAAVGGVGD